MAPIFTRFAPETHLGNCGEGRRDPEAAVAALGKLIKINIVTTTTITTTTTTTTTTTSTSTSTTTNNNNNNNNNIHLITDYCYN